MKLPKPKPKSKPEPSAEASKLIFILAGVIVVVAGLKLASDFFIPILLAFFFATISFPILNWLREHRVPRLFAVLITILVDFAFIAGVVFVGIILVSDISSKWDSKYYQKTNERLDQLTEATSEFYNKWAPTPKVKKDGAEGAKAEKPVTKDGQVVGDAEPAVGINPTNGPVDPAGAQELAGASASTAADDASGASKKVKPGALEKATASLEAKNAEINTDEAALAGIEQFKEQILQQISTKNVWEWARSILDQLISFLKTAFIVLLITVFMLSEARMFGRRMNAICDAQGPNLQRMLSAIRDIQKYLGIKTMISMATGLLAGILCWQMGLEFPLLWGILAFALNFIPAVGSIIAGIPPVLLSLLDNGSIPEAAIIGGGYLLINGVLGNFLEPSLLGRRFGISTVVVILSVIFWGWLWGAVGMLMAVPLTMLLKVALDNSSDLRWIAVAISKETKTSKEADEILIKESIESKGKPMTEDIAL